MFIKKMETNIFVNRSDGLKAGHLTIIEGTGAGHLPTKIARRTGHLTIFFKCPGEILAAGTDSHNKLLTNTANFRLCIVTQP